MNFYKSIIASAVISFFSGLAFYSLTKMDVLEILAVMTLIYLGSVTIWGLIFEELSNRRINNMISSKKIETQEDKDDLGA